ncbi:MAG: class I SAM-dependent methyltransferase [Candidatus Acidiferrum sp.]
MTFADAKQRFSNRVADYARYRPGYPAALYDLLAKQCGLQRDHVVADIGSGTGLLSKVFLDRGNRVYGIEPNAEMRSAGEEILHSYSNFTSVDGSAESTTLPASSVDFVTVGQAFHWFDVAATQREFRRILKPGGWCTVVWQDRRMHETAFARDYEYVLQRFGVDYKSVKDTYPETEKMRQFFDPGTFRSHQLRNHQDFDWEGLQGRLRSSSYAPTENHPNYAPMIAQLRNIYNAYQNKGSVRMEYFAHVYLGQLGGNTR